MPQYPQNSVVDGVAVVIMTAAQFDSLVEHALGWITATRVLLDVTIDQINRTGPIADFLPGAKALHESRSGEGFAAPQEWRDLVSGSAPGVSLSPDVENFAGGTPELAAEHVDISSAASIEAATDIVSGAGDTTKRRARKAAQRFKRQGWEN